MSRQRTWGVPIPLFVDKVSGELHPNTAALIEEIAKLVEQGGIDTWFDLDAAALLGPDADRYDKATDVMDVWFDSGVVHHCLSQMRPEITVPADLYLEGSDQHRGWFHSSLLTSLVAACMAARPYRGVLLTHGFTVDAEGPQDVEVDRQYAGAAKIDEYAGRGCRAPVGGGDRLRQ